MNFLLYTLSLFLIFIFIYIVAYSYELQSKVLTKVFEVKFNIFLRYASIFVSRSIGGLVRILGLDFITGFGTL